MLRIYLGNIIIRYCIDICGPVVSWENHPWWSGHYGLKSGKKLSKKFNFKIFHINFRFLFKINTPKNTLKQTQNLKCFTYRFIWIFFFFQNDFYFIESDPDLHGCCCGSRIRILSSMFADPQYAHNCFSCVFGSY